jgi:hypothetical protein
VAETRFGNEEGAPLHLPYFGGGCRETGQLKGRYRALLLPYFWSSGRRSDPPIDCIGTRPVFASDRCSITDSYELRARAR